MRVGAAQEHVHVEIGFHHHRIGLPGPFHRFFGHVAEVRHEHEQASFTSDGETHRLRGVVRDFEVLDFDALRDRVPGVRHQVAPAAADFQPRERMVQQGVMQDGRRIDRLGKAFTYRT